MMFKLVKSINFNVSEHLNFLNVSVVDRSDIEVIIAELSLCSFDKVALTSTASSSDKEKYLSDMACSVAYAMGYILDTSSLKADDSVVEYEVF